MADEQTTQPSTEYTGPPAPATASKGDVTLTSMDGDQAGVERALGIEPEAPPASTPAPQATEPASEAPATEPASEATPPADPLPTVQPGDTPRVQDRINTLTRRNKDFERENAQLKAQLKALLEPVEADTSPAPNPADFGTDTQGYIEAATRHTARQVLQEQTAARQEQAATAQTEAGQAHDNAAWIAEVAAVQAKHADYAEVMTKAAGTEADTPAMHAMLRQLQQVPQGAEVFYELAKKPGELTRISTLSPLEQTAELVLASRALQAPPANGAAPPASDEPPAADAAPPVREPTPITPVTPTGGPGDVVLNEFSSHDDYLRWRAQQVPP